MEHISNEEKAKHIAANLVFELIEPLVLSKEQRQQIEFKMYYALIEMAEWKDEQHKKEKQQWIEEAAEWLKHNIYDYFYWIEMEGESEANIKDTLFDDFKKSSGGINYGRN